MSSETKPQDEEAPPTRKTQFQPTRETQSPPTLETSSSPTPHENPAESSYKVATEEIALGSAEASGGVSNLWGLSEKLDSWQVSSLPQDKVYFALQGNVFEAALSAIKTHLDASDGTVRGGWILTEVDHWDIERERIVVLTDCKIISVKYDFIHGLVEELKRISLNPAYDYTYGDFKYPNTYFYTRTGKGLRLEWDKSVQLGFFDRWNPMSNKCAYTMFCSHILVRKGFVQEPHLSIVNFMPEVEKVLQEMQAKTQPPEGASNTSPIPFEIKKADIVLDTRLGLSAMVHNQSSLGFSKKRGLVDW